MAIENKIMSASINSVSGLAQKGDKYVKSIQVWVISLTSIRVEERKNAESAQKGLNSIHFKGGYISTYGADTSWPFLWFMGNTKWTSYKTVSVVEELDPIKGEVTTVTGQARPLTSLAKAHEGEALPYNINIPLTGNLLTGLFSPDEEDYKTVQHMKAARVTLEAKLQDLSAKYGEVQLHITVGMSPDTWSSAAVKKLYKSSSQQEDRYAFEIALQDRDILGLKWVVPTDSTFVPGLNLGQIVDITSEMMEVEECKEVLTPDEVLPKDAAVMRFLNKNYGKFVKDGSLDHSLVETRKAFLGTLTGSFAKWALIAEKEVKALEVLANWKPTGKEGARRVMGKREEVTETSVTPVTAPVSKVESLEKQVVSPTLTVSLPMKEAPAEEEVQEVTPVRTGGSRMGSRLGNIASIGSSLSGDFE